MFPFFESLCVQEGKILHASWHELRFKHTYTFFYGTPPPYGLLDRLRMPDNFSVGTVKLRIAYNRTERKTVFEHYKITPIRRIRLVKTNALAYSFKFSNRQVLNQLFALRGPCDDILIVKRGIVTDSSYANILFFDGKQWFTPAQPLLKGTCRARLLANGVITPATITPKDLKRFVGFKLINALRDMQQEMLPITAIMEEES